MNSRQALESALSAVWPKRNLPRIIYYHSIHPDAPLSHRPSTFGEQLRWLKDHDFRPFSLSAAGALLAEGKLPRGAVIITFDDGYEDNWVHATPLLAREGITATFFIVSAMVGNEPMDSGKGHKLYPGLKMMSRAQVRDLVGAGMEIGSHTRTHVHARETQIRSVVALADELRGSREDLEGIAGAAVTSFAYPNGQRGVFSPATREAVVRAGYTLAVTTMWGGLGPGQDLLQLPRMEIKHTDSLEVFARKMAGQYDFMSPYCRLVDRSARW